jgi:hypothetical protein
MQVIPTESLAPPPHRGQGWRKGGCGQEKRYAPASRRFFSAKFQSAPKNFRQFWFSSELFWNFQISNQKKSGRKMFAPKFFTISNFRPENFPVFQISRPKKVRVLWHPDPDNRQRFTTVVPVSCQTDNLFSNFRANFFFFFQFSIQKFLGFSTFEPKKDRPYQLSNQKFLPGKHFRPHERDTIGRIKSCGPGSLRRDICNKGHFFQLSRRSFQNFLARKFVQVQRLRENGPKKYPKGRQ